MMLVISPIANEAMDRRLPRYLYLDHRFPLRRAHDSSTSTTKRTSVRLRPGLIPRKRPTSRGALNAVRAECAAPFAFLRSLPFRLSLAADCVI